MKQLAILLVLALTACEGDVLTPVQLQDPNACLDCHPRHFKEWSGSMHAYASDDPVFVAMNKRGQRETNGELGLFCVNCHAPMAVRNGTITEANVAAFDPAALSPSERGITCYFCHNIDKVTSDHNNPIILANDSTMRSGLRDPVDSPAHRHEYDARMDGDVNQSEICGSCHDIVTPSGFHLERTFAEWKATIFSNDSSVLKNSCSGCHMPSSPDLVADGPGLDVPRRDNPPAFHSHMFAGIDQALTPFPEMAEQATAINDILKGSITITGPKPRTGPTPGGICVDPPGVISVRIDNVGSGHSWPSGAAMDRRAWLELIAYRADNTIVFQSGVVPAGVDPEDIGDPNILGLWDRTFKADGKPAHFFWEVASNDPSFLLRGPTTLDQNDPAFDHSITHRFRNIFNYGEIERITARIRIRALPFALIHELEASGDLSPSQAADIASRLQTLEIQATQRTWDRATAGTGAAQFTNCSPR